MIEMNRRFFLGGLTAAIAAPFIVRSGILMPVKSLYKPIIESFLEASYDGHSWFCITKIVTTKAMTPRPFNIDTTKYKYTRVIFNRDWEQRPNLMSDPRDLRFIPCSKPEEKINWLCQPLKGYSS